MLLLIMTWLILQWFPDIIGWICGEEKGSLAYVDIAKELGRWMLPHGQLFK